MSETDKGVVANVNNIGTLRAFKVPNELRKHGMKVNGVEPAYVMYLGERINGWLSIKEDGTRWFGPDPKDENAWLLDSIEKKLER